MIYVLTDKDGENGQSITIGVFDNPEAAKNKLKDYYGDYEELKHDDVRDSGIEWVKHIKVDGRIDRAILEYFTLNEI
jgi:hypothetical protein